MCKYTISNTASSSSKTVSEAEVSFQDLDMSSLFSMMEEERIEKLRKSLKELIINKVMPVCAKNLNLDTGSVMEFQENSLDQIVDDMIDLGEEEPYGINGGKICLHFGSSLADAGDSGQRIGKFEICSSNVSTYELHLTLIPSTNLKHKMNNLMRRFQAKPPILVVDNQYSLVKRSLYRGRNSCWSEET